MARERHAPRKLTGRVVETITPATIRRPFANYSHGIVVPAGSRLLFASGQLGITADACPAFVEEQSSGAATTFELVGVNVNKDVATADIDATSDDGSGPSRLTVLLAREEGEWVITALQ